MWPLLWLLFLPLAIILLLLAGGLILNDLPWSDPPGVAVRLERYLDTSVAETVESSPFPELRPRHYPEVPPDELYRVVERAIVSLGDWTLAARDGRARRFEAVVSTPLLRFQDDVTIHVIPDPRTKGSTLFMRSQSRIGAGDLGANTRHILDLTERVDALLRQSPPTTEAVSR